MAGHRRKRGLGREITRAALAAGDRVVATARQPHALDELAAAYQGRLAVLALDVSDRAAVFATVTEALSVFGRCDVVVNNAGYGLMGAIVVVEDRYSRLFKVEHVQPGFVAELLAAVQVRYPAVPIVFLESRPLAEEWTFRFLGAALAYARADQSPAAEAGPRLGET